MCRVAGKELELEREWEGGCMRKKSLRIKVSLPPNTVYFLRRRADVYDMTLPAYIRQLVFREIQHLLPLAIRQQPDPTATNEGGRQPKIQERNIRQPLSNAEFFSTLEAFQQGRLPDSLLSSREW